MPRSSKPPAATEAPRRSRDPAQATARRAVTPAPRRRPRGVDNEERWSEILSAAGDIFSQDGYQSASLERIASAVGMLKGSVYYYINTKEDLLFEMIMRSLDEREQTIAESAEEAAAPARERLRTFMLRWMAVATDEKVPFAIVLEREFRWLSPARLRTVIARRDEFGTFVKGIITAGTRSGEFRSDTDPSVAANAIFLLMNNIPLWFRHSGRWSISTVHAWTADFAVHGLAAPPPPRRRPARKPAGAPPKAAIAPRGPKAATAAALRKTTSRKAPGSTPIGPAAATDSGRVTPRRRGAAPSPKKR